MKAILNNSTATNERLAKALSALDKIERDSIPTSTQIALLTMRQALEEIVADAVCPNRVINFENIGFMVELPSEYSETPEAIVGAADELNRLSILLTEIVNRLSALEKQP